MKASVKAFRILSALFLLAFSVYALLDTFLIPRVYASVESPAAAAEESCRNRRSRKTAIPTILSAWRSAAIGWRIPPSMWRTSG